MQWLNTGEQNVVSSFLVSKDRTIQFSISKWQQWCYIYLKADHFPKYYYTIFALFATNMQPSKLSWELVQCLQCHNTLQSLLIELYLSYFLLQNFSNIGVTGHFVQPVCFVCTVFFQQHPCSLILSFQVTDRIIRMIIPIWGMVLALL